MEERKKNQCTNTTTALHREAFKWTKPEVVMQLEVRRGGHALIHGPDNVRAGNTHTHTHMITQDASQNKSSMT